MSSVSRDLNPDVTSAHLVAARDAVQISKAGAKVLDDEALIRRTFAEDPRQGCEILFRVYFQSLCSHAVRMLYSKSIAEDLVSEVFYQFYAKGTYLEITTSFRAYLFKAVRSRALNFMKWEAGRNADLELYEEVSDRACGEPDSIVEYEELYHAIQDAINAMPPQRRKIFLLNRFENQKYAEIATEMGLSPRTVEVQIRKASIYLKGVLKIKLGILISLLLPILAIFYR